jgi:hypothetical protein
MKRTCLDYSQYTSMSGKLPILYGAMATGAQNLCRLVTGTFWVFFNNFKEL